MPLSGSGDRGGRGYSSVVRLALRVDGRLIPLTQVGSDRLYFESPVMIPACRATLIVEIDGQSSETSVNLQGTPQPSRIVTFEQIDHSPSAPSSDPMPRRNLHVSNDPSTHD